MRLAQVGFFYAPVQQAPDRVECFACGTAVARWKPHSDPKTEHLRYAPNCPFLNGNYEKYRYEAARLQSFVGKWNLAEDYLAQPWRLAKSGFFYAPKPGGGDRCECFCCGIALVRWEKPDDPWREHQKHAPTCAFVRGLPTDNILLPGMVEVPVAKKKKTEMEGLIEEIERLNIPYDEVLPSYFMCPITQDLIRDPIVLEDGHSYEKSAIFQWLTSHNTSPLTNKPLTTKLLFPNHNLKQQLVEFAEKLLESHRDQQSNPPTTSFADNPSSSSSSSSSLAASSSSSAPADSPSISFAQGVVASAPPCTDDPPPCSLDLSDELWLEPILAACEELVAAHRDLTLARDHQTKPRQPIVSLIDDDEESEAAEIPSREEEDDEAASSVVDDAQARFDAAEQRLRSIQKEVVASRAEHALRSFVTAEQLRVRTEAETLLADARERAAEIVAEAQQTAQAVAEEESSRLRDDNAALIASIETLSRQKEQLEAGIQALTVKSAALYPSIPAASTSSPLPLSTSSSSSVPPASAPPLEEQVLSESDPSSPAPVAKRKSTFASFFGFN